jgi:hypothetical protein
MAKRITAGMTNATGALIKSQRLGLRSLMHAAMNSPIHAITGPNGNRFSIRYWSDVRPGLSRSGRISGARSQGSRWNPTKLVTAKNQPSATKIRNSKFWRSIKAFALHPTHAGRNVTGRFGKYRRRRFSYRQGSVPERVAAAPGQLFVPHDRKRVYNHGAPCRQYTRDQHSSR